MGDSRTCLYVNGQTEYSQSQGYALHMVGPARCGILWAVETEWNHHKGSVSYAIDEFEPSIEGETATIPIETRQSYPPAWQCSATCHKTGQDILGNVEMEDLPPPAVLSGRCSFRIPFVSIDGTRPGSSTFPLLWRSQKIDRFVDRLKRRIVFSRENFKNEEIIINRNNLRKFWNCFNSIFTHPIKCRELSSVRFLNSHNWLPLPG